MLKFKLSLFFIVFSVFFISKPLHSQVIAKGSVIDEKTKKPLIYANVALASKNKGTVTNEKGFFTLDLTEKDLNDSLLVSYVGYKTKKLPVSLAIETSSEILLTEEVNTLDEVLIVSKEAKYSSPKTLGIRKKGTIASSIPFGYEKATLIENNERRLGKVKSVIFHVKKEDKNTYEVYQAYFRIKFYGYNKLINSPGELLCYDDILVKPENKSQKINIDVSKYNISMPKEGVVVGIEVINPNVTKPKTSMYAISPRLVITQTKEAFSWSRIYGRPWNANTRKSFVKSKLYTSILLNLEVEFRK